MRNFLCALLLAVFPLVSSADTSDNLYEFPLSNGINVALYEDFNFPIVMVGIIYDVGALDAPKKMQGSIGEFAKKFLIPSKTRSKFIENGITYTLNIHEGYTELIGEMHPKNVKAFFSAVTEFAPEQGKIDYERQQISLLHDIRKINELDVIKNVCLGSLSKVTPLLIFNKQGINGISSEELFHFLEKFNTCNIKIVVCGAISHGGLIKAMKNSVCTMSQRRQIVSRSFEKGEKKEIHVRGRQRNNALHFYYLLPTSFDKSEAYWYIFNELLTEFFQNEYAYARDIISQPCMHYGNTVWEISLYPKSDISLNKLQKLYTAFTAKVLNTPLQKEFLVSIADNAKNDLKFVKTDLNQLYEIIKETMLNNRDVKDTFGYVNEITEIPPRKFKKTTSAMIKKNNLLKIIEKYRDDR